MRTYAMRTLGVLLTLLGTSCAQTYTACDPTNTTCPPTPGLNSNYYFIDFTKVQSTPQDWIVPTWCRVTYNTKGRQNGAELEFLERYDSQQLFSSFYFLFGRVEFVVQAAPGPGIISDMMTLSDDLDELDWEFRGTLDDEVQTGWFGKGVTGLYNHSITPKIPTPMTQFHTYAFDWTPERVVWQDDGAVVRTLYASDCIGTANQYPQTPMKAMMGLWDAGDPDHYDPWSAGVTPIPPPAGGYSFYVKSVKIWNSNPAACYNWVDHSGTWQSIKGLNDSSACGISPKSSAVIMSTSSAQSSSSTIRSSSSAQLSSSTIGTSSSAQPASSTIRSSASAQPSSLSIKSSSSTRSPLSETASSTSVTIATTSSALSAPFSQSTLTSSRQLSASLSTLPVLSSSASLMTLASPTTSVTIGPSPSTASSNLVSLPTKSSNTVDSSLSSLGVDSLSLRTQSSSSPTMQASNSQPSSTHPSSTLSGSTQSSSTHSPSMSSPSSVGGSVDMSVATSSSTSQDAILSIQTGHPPSSAAPISPNPQSSAQLQTTSGKASVSSSTGIGSLTASLKTSSATGSMTINSLSVQTGKPSNIVSSTAKALSVSPPTQSTAVTSASRPASSAMLPTTTAVPKSTLLPTTIISWRHTLTIIAVLPGPQTLSYYPVVENLTALIASLENVMHRHPHQSKRELASVSAEQSVAVSQSGLSDAAAQRHHHGHQHDHLHDQLHRRSVRNESHVAPAQGASAGIAVGSLAMSTTDVTISGDEAGTANAWTTEAASKSDHTTDQIAGPNANTSPIADGQDPSPSFDRVNDKAAAPRVVSAAQSTVSLATPAYLGGSSARVTAADTGAQSVLQQQFSAAGRVSPFGKSAAILCHLWAYFLVVR